MKKVICFLGALLFVMTGCATKSQSTETSKSSTTTSIEKSETGTSEAKEETKVLTAEINGNQHRYTITTKGDKVQKLKLDVLSALPEKIATNSANLSPEEMTKIINEGLQSDSEYKALKDTAGFSIEYKVTPQTVWKNQLGKWAENQPVIISVAQRSKHKTATNPISNFFFIAPSTF